MKVSVPKKADRFPLFIHKGRGYWCKTVLGKHHYFGKVADDPQGKEALKLWLYEKDWLLAGLEPPPYDPNGEQKVSVKYICNKFLEAKEAKLEAGDLSQRTFDELKETCKLVFDSIPATLEAKLLVPAHFNKLLSSINKRYKSPNSRGKFIGQVKAIFKFAYENGEIERPTNIGTEFKKPSQKSIRQHENTKGDQSLSADEVKSLLKHASINMRAMLFLGLQAGFSNVELAELPRSAIKGDWLEWPRAKTATKRRIPLWKETKQAIQEAIKAGKPDGELVFYRNAIRYRDRRFICYEFTKTAKLAGVENHTFYDLRRSFQTVAENACQDYDLPAIKAIMGHTDKRNDMSAGYRQNISDERLLAVTNAVRKWLGKIPKGGAK
jgi:integrase